MTTTEETSEGTGVSDQAGGSSTERSPVGDLHRPGPLTAVSEPSHALGETFAAPDERERTALLAPEYKGTVLRAPSKALLAIPHGLTELSGPVFGESTVRPEDADLTRVGPGEAIGPRIIVHGTVREAGGRPVPNTLIEIWQANAAGRYRHVVDRWGAPLDPNFAGAGRVLTDAEGRYRFVTVAPGAYPWGNHPNAWRPPHIHFSLFGRAFLQRLVTQMYFEGDPLLAHDPIFNAVRDEAVRNRMVATLDMDATEADHAVAYRFDIVLRGSGRTPMEDES